MMAPQTEKMKISREKRSNLAFPAPSPRTAVSIFFSFSRSYIVRVTYSSFFVFVFALNPIVTSKIFLVFGTGALNALRLFYFRIFENGHIIAYTHTHFTPDDADKNVKAFYIDVFEA